MTSPIDPEVLLADIDTRRMNSHHVETAPALIKSIPELLTEAATTLIGKQAVLRGLIESYTEAGGEGVATHEAIHNAIKAGVTGKQAEDDCAVLRKAFEEASGGKSPTLKALVEAIHRGAR